MKEEEKEAIVDLFEEVFKNMNFDEDTLLRLSTCLCGIALRKRVNADLFRKSLERLYTNGIEDANYSMSPDFLKREERCMALLNKCRIQIDIILSMNKAIDKLEQETD